MGRGWESGFCGIGDRGAAGRIRGFSAEDVGGGLLGFEFCAMDW